MPVSLPVLSAVHEFVAEMSGPDVTGSTTSTNVMNATSHLVADVTDAAEARGLALLALGPVAPTTFASRMLAGRPCSSLAAVRQCAPCAPHRSGGSERSPRQFENKTALGRLPVLFASGSFPCFRPVGFSFPCRGFAQWAFMRSSGSRASSCPVGLSL